MRPTLFITLSLLLAISLSCNTPQNKVSTQLTHTVKAGFAQTIEQAHGLESWKQHDILSFDFLLYFRGKERMNAQISMATDMSQVKIQTQDGAEMLYVDDKAYISPADAKYRRPRFDLLTWPYFLAIPFKVNDPGTKLTAIDSLDLGEVLHETRKLSFGEGVGDAPDDWYKILKEPESDLLKALVYIVTFSKSQEEAEQDPHAIVYSDFQEVGGTVLPASWTFRNWRDGSFRDTIGSASLSNIRFIEASEVSFEVPAGARMDER